MIIYNLIYFIIRLLHTTTKRNSALCVGFPQLFEQVLKNRWHLCALTRCKKTTVEVFIRLLRMCHRLDMQSPGVSVPQINSRPISNNTIKTSIVRGFLVALHKPRDQFCEIATQRILQHVGNHTVSFLRLYRYNATGMVPVAWRWWRGSRSVWSIHSVDTTVDASLVPHTAVTSPA